MVGACSTQRLDVNMHTQFWFESLKGRPHRQDLGADGRTILKWILRQLGGRRWTGIHLAQDRDRWRALANTAMNL
jgi:hypothetical protein